MQQNSILELILKSKFCIKKLINSKRLWNTILAGLCVSRRSFLKDRDLRLFVKKWRKRDRRLLKKLSLKLHKMIHLNHFIKSLFF